MAFLNFTGSLLTLILGIFLFVNSKSAIHEGVATLFVLCSAVFFAGGSICFRIASLKGEFVKKAAVVSKRGDQKLSEMNPETDGEAMARFGIRLEAGQYLYGVYRYDKLTDAIAFARKDHGES